jgi:hypothetical protein
MKFTLSSILSPQGRGRPFLLKGISERKEKSVFS